MWLNSIPRSVFRRSTRASLLLAALALLAAFAPAQAQVTLPCGMTFTESTTPAVITIDWRSPKTKDCEQVTIPGGIAVGNPVAVRSLNFNFLAFQMEYQVTVDTIASYQLLEKLWQQIFAIGALGAASDERDDFGKKLNSWRLYMSETDAQLTDFLTEARKQGFAVSAPFMTLVNTADSLFRVRQATIGALRASARQAVTTSNILDAFDRYAKALAEQQELLKRMDTYFSASEATRLGMSKVIPARKSGELVAVTVLPKKSDGATIPEGARTVRFLSRSKLPLAMHIGVGVSKLDRSTFERVRTVAGQDLYSQIADSAAKPDLILSLSVRPLTKQADWFLLSLGTGVFKPGETLFAGASIEFFRRAMVSFGGASSEVSAGKNRIIDPLGAQLGTRELFDAVSKRREWKPFVSLSLAVR